MLKKPQYPQVIKFPLATAERLQNMTETPILMIGEEDLARLGIRQRRAVLRSRWRGRMTRYYVLGRWSGWSGYSSDKVRQRRGRLIVRLNELRRRRRRGLVKRLADELGVSRCTIWRDLDQLRRARIITAWRRSPGQE